MLCSTGFSSSQTSCVNLEMCPCGANLFLSEWMRMNTLCFSELALGCLSLPQHRAAYFNCMWCKGIFCPFLYLLSPRVSLLSRGGEEPVTIQVGLRVASDSQHQQQLSLPLGQTPLKDSGRSGHMRGVSQNFCGLLRVYTWCPHLYNFLPSRQWDFNSNITNYVQSRLEVFSDSLRQLIGKGMVVMAGHVCPHSLSLSLFISCFLLLLAFILCWIYSWAISFLFL